MKLESGREGAIPFSVSFQNELTLLRLMPLSPLPEGTSITLTVTGIEDGSGNRISPIVASFATKTPTRALLRPKNDVACRIAPTKSKYDIKQPKWPVYSLKPVKEMR